MGVNIFILDRRATKLAIAGVVQDVGSLRRFWKITELDEERAGELSASEAAVSAMPSPKAAMIADVVEVPLASRPDIEISAHQVIGWDEGRTSVTDMGWDYLPVLGYAVRDPDSGVFTLHERCDGVLHPLGRRHRRGVPRRQRRAPARTGPARADVRPLPRARCSRALCPRATVCSRDAFGASHFTNYCWMYKGTSMTAKDAEGCLGHNDSD